MQPTASSLAASGKGPSPGGKVRLTDALAQLTVVLTEANGVLGAKELHAVEEWKEDAQLSVRPGKGQQHQPSVEPKAELLGAIKAGAYKLCKTSGGDLPCYTALDTLQYLALHVVGLGSSAFLTSRLWLAQLGRGREGTRQLHLERA